MLFTNLIITLPTFACLFWACIFLLEYRKGPKEKRLMCWFMITATLLYFGHYCYFSKAYGILPVTDTLYSMANLAVYPIYYLYVRYITTNRLEIKRCLLVLLPAALIGISNLLAYSFENKESVDAFIAEYLYHEERAMADSITYHWLYVNHALARFCFAAMVLITILLCYRMIRQFDQRLKEFYSNREGRNMNVIMTLQISMVITSVGAVILNVLGKSFFVDNILLAIPSLAFSSLLFAIGYDAYRRTFTARIFEDEQKNAPIEELSTEKIESELSVRLIKILNEEQLYLQTDLKITDLARVLATNRNYIYLAIKNDLNTNFSDLINKMRIEHAQKLIDKDPSCPLSEVALMSGYTSESSFYRNFKKQTGATPAEHKRREQG